jgi:hypothetical protein
MLKEQASARAFNGLTQSMRWQQWNVHQRQTMIPHSMDIVVTLHLMMKEVTAM